MIGESGTSSVAKDQGGSELLGCTAVRGRVKVGVSTDNNWTRRGGFVFGKVKAVGWVIIA